MKKQLSIARLSGLLGGGTFIIFVGIVLSRLFGFLYRFILARYLGPDKYGLFSLGIMVTGILSMITLFGLHEGAKRFIVYYKEKNRTDKLKGTVLVSLITVVSLSIVISTPVYLLSDQISRILFSKPELSSVLKIFAMAVVFNSLLLLLQEIFVGFERPKLRALTEGFGLRFCPLILAVFVILAGGDIVDISMSYLLGLFIASLAGYFILYQYFFHQSEGGTVFCYKELFYFSAPLFFTGIVNMLHKWTDIFFIGVFLPAASAGIYSAVFTIANSMPSINVAISALFLPRAIRYFVNDDIGELKKDFYSTQKKIFIFTLPVAVIFIFCPDFLIGIAFGEAFKAGSLSMIILSIGFFGGMSFCPGQSVLLATGKTRLLLSINFGISLLNIMLNFVLIQIYGIEGAAASTSFCVFLRYALMYLFVRQFFASAG